MGMGLRLEKPLHLGAPFNRPTENQESHSGIQEPQDEDTTLHR